MADKETIEWVKKEKTKGYSDEQIKQTMSDQGYDSKNIDYILKSSKEDEKPQSVSFNEFVTKKGKLFKWIIHASIGLFAIQLIMPLLLIPAFFITNFSSTTVYIILSIYSLIIGFILAYAYNIMSDKSRGMITSGVYYSLFIAFILAFNNAVMNIMINMQKFLIEKIESMAPESAKFGFEIINLNIIDMNIIFLVIIISFNLPFLIYFFMRKEKNYFWIILYFTPVLIYFGINYVFNILVDIITDFGKGLITQKINGVTQNIPIDKIKT